MPVKKLTGHQTSTFDPRRRGHQMQAIVLRCGRDIRYQRFLSWSVSCPVTFPRYGPISSSTFAVYVPSANMTGVSQTPLQPNFMFSSALTLPSRIRVNLGDFLSPAPLSMRSVQPFPSLSPAEIIGFPFLIPELIFH